MWEPSCNAALTDTVLARKASLYNMKQRKQVPEFVLRSHVSSNKIPEYNSLQDANLAGYFTRKAPRKILEKNGFLNTCGAGFNQTAGKSPLLALSLYRKQPSLKKRVPANVQLKPLSKDEFQQLLTNTRKSQLFSSINKPQAV